MVFVYTAMGVLCVEHANVLELCYIELLSGDGSPYSILSVFDLQEAHDESVSALEMDLSFFHKV